MVSLLSLEENEMPDAWNHEGRRPHGGECRPGRRLGEVSLETTRTVGERQTFVEVRVGHDTHRVSLVGRVERAEHVVVGDSDALRHTLPSLALA